MDTKDINISFIGAGRITGIILRAWEQQNMVLKNVTIYDHDFDKAKGLSQQFSQVNAVETISEAVKSSHVLYLALHPPVFGDVLNEIKPFISENALVISLAPKVRIAKIQEMIGKKLAVARVIPNAPSVIGKGYNVYALSGEVQEEQSAILQTLFEPLGTLKAVEEPLLESYATITGMGPTYLWFLFQEFYQHALKFGLTEKDAAQAVNAMIHGTSETLFHSGLSYEQVLDLIPAYPFKPQEENIKTIYAESLSNLFNKLSQ
ncbi:MAG TPA: NAD(P)-binding domain-containing protein [Bacteroidia bacterium]|nr:NAD(P)-binding domain-containing protein [Bacteroidia bacterium]HRS59888.1 NAD(P)-binding domain-containing protein [Bacteroidia bacterium]HRU68326.1 NAD(P)-binding domain-containing protein [Bacteroidia bacterium]